jgi:hypothetical protein
MYMCIWSVDLSNVQYRCAKHHQINQQTNNQYTVKPVLRGHPWDQEKVAL